MGLMARTVSVWIRTSRLAQRPTNLETSRTPAQMAAPTPTLRCFDPNRFLERCTEKAEHYLSTAMFPSLLGVWALGKPCNRALVHARPRHGVGAAMYSLSFDNDGWCPDVRYHFLQHVCVAWTNL